MAIQFQCPKCAVRYKGNDDLVGRRANCPSCGESFIVPEPLLDVAPPVSSRTTTVVRKTSATPRKRRWLDGKNADRILFGCALAICFGIIFGAVNQKDYRLSLAASTEPERVDLAAIEKGQLPNNVHLEIGPHIGLFGKAICVYEKLNIDFRNASPNTTCKYVLYPIVSNEHPFGAEANALARVYDTIDQIPDDKKPLLETFAVLVKSTEFKTLGDVPAGAEQRPLLRGMNISRVARPDLDERRMLAAEYPKLNLDNLVFFETGRTPVPSVKALCKMLAGYAFSAAAAAIGVWTFLAKRRMRSAMPESAA
jgi:hypothetical protein